MYNTTTNLYVFIIFLITLAFELLITKLMDISPGLLWGLTIGLYFMFVLYQILIKMNEDSEKNRIKLLLYEIMDSINGISIVNQNEKLVIKWDMVFKKLVDNKEFELYDKILKLKTSHIDSYVNKYPSLLKDDSIDFRESRGSMDLNSTIRGKKKKDKKADEELVKEEENKRKLFIRDINTDTVTFTNYNSSIHIDVMLKHEYVPENAPEIGIEHDPDYDGFSVWMAFRNDKYNVVPRVIVHKKKVNKEKWFFDNIGSLLNSAAIIVNGDTSHTMYIDNYKLQEYLEDMPDENEDPSSLTFQLLENDKLIFMANDKKNKIKTTAYCELKTGYNRFEVILKEVIIKESDQVNHLELEKTVAIGSSFQPIVTLLEKMPQLIKNIELTINNKDISSIVIS